MKFIIRELKKQNVNASEELTLKDIAANNNIGPIDLYDKIKGIVQD